MTSLTAGADPCTVWACRSPPGPRAGRAVAPGSAAFVSGGGGLPYANHCPSGDNRYAEPSLGTGPPTECGGGGGAAALTDRPTREPARRAAGGGCRRTPEGDHAMRPDRRLRYAECCCSRDDPYAEWECDWVLDGSVSTLGCASLTRHGEGWVGLVVNFCEFPEAMPKGAEGMRRAPPGWFRCCFPLVGFRRYDL